MNYTSDELRMIWLQSTSPRLNPSGEIGTFALDKFGYLIRFEDYGKAEKSPFSREVDHIIALNEGGPHEMTNLQALYWKANRRKGG